MKNNGKNNGSAEIALIIAGLYALSTVFYNSQKKEILNKQHQDSKGTSSSISSEYVKDESELEQALIMPKEDTAEENSEEQLSTDSEQLNESSSTNANKPQKMYYYHNISMYNKYIVYVNNEDFGARYYLFDWDVETKKFIEVNGLFAIPSDDVTKCFTTFCFMTDEEHQTLNNYGKIRSVDEILATLNKKYANKTNEEILKQIQSDAYTNVEYCIYDIELVSIKNENDKDIIIAVIDLGTGFYYEINGTQYYDKNELFYHAQSFKNLSGIVLDEYGKGRGINHLCVNKINEICDSINQNLNQEISGKLRSLIK